MRIAILGTRGIPNNYGGFEQFADVLSQGLAKQGHDVFVYCSANHQYADSEYNGVKLIHKYDPENKIGAVGQFVYDLLCMLDARKRNFDIVYLLGYTSSSVWQRLLYKQGPIVITNMDGLEWKRSKYSKPVQQFLKLAEKLAVKYSDYLVADSIGIQSYLKQKYNAEAPYFPYGSYVFENPNENVLEKYKLKAFGYDILIARFEPENNIEMVLEAFRVSTVSRLLLLIGNYEHTPFGKQMYNRFYADGRIRFLGAIYDQDELNNLRYFSNLYFHGHSVGGTNPSLLEAMGSNALICYHDNEFNSAIVGEDGFAFANSDQLSVLISRLDKGRSSHCLTANRGKINKLYEWKKIIVDYENYFQSLCNR